MERSVGSLNNEASHGLCLCQVELHGFDSNGTVLLRLDEDHHPPSGDNRSVGRRPLTGSWFSGSDSRWQGGGVMFFDLDLDVTMAGMPNSVCEVPHRDGWGWSKQSQFLRHPDRGGVIHQVNHLLGHAVVVVQQGDMGDRPRSS